MQAIVIEKWQEPAALRVGTIDAPLLSDGCVIVDIRCAGVNFFDILMCQGRYQLKPPFPFVLGAEFSGVIAAVAPDVTHFRVGDRVFGGAFTGAFAEKTCVHASAVRHMPRDASFEAASGWFVTLPTAYAGLVIRAGLKAGDIVAVSGASGGVGVAAMQIARALGARVIALTSNVEKTGMLQAAGAHDVVCTAGGADWPALIRDVTSGAGVDIFFDNVGFGVEVTKCMAWNGRHLVVGFAGGSIPSVPLNRVLLKNMAIVGVQWGAYQYNEPETIERVWTPLESLLREGKIRTVVHDRVFSLSEVPLALRVLQDRAVTGKAVIRMSGGDVVARPRL